MGAALPLAGRRACNQDDSKLEPWRCRRSQDYGLRHKSIDVVYFFPDLTILNTLQSRIGTPDAPITTKLTAQKGEFRMGIHPSII